MTNLTELPGSSNGGQEAETAQVLDNALKQMLAGRSIGAILDELPAGTDLPEITSLLKTAQRVRETTDPVPDPDLKDQGLKALLKAVPQR